MEYFVCLLRGVLFFFVIVYDVSNKWICLDLFASYLYKCCVYCVFIYFMFILYSNVYVFCILVG